MSVANCKCMKQKQRAQIPIGMTLYVGQGESERGEEVR